VTGDYIGDLTARRLPPRLTRASFLRQSVAVVSVVLVAAGCGGVGKPLAGKDLSRAAGRLSAIQADFAARDAQSFSADEIPAYLRGVAARYDRLAGYVGGVVIDDRSPEEQQAWTALYQLAALRARHLQNVAEELTSSPDLEATIAMNQAVGGTLEQSAVDKLNAALAGVRRPPFD
jgi:hypothetical protein